MRYIILYNDARLCKDGKFRDLAFFGTFPTCVKFYRKKGWASRKQDQFLRQGTETTIVVLRDGDTIDASGKIVYRKRN